MSLHTHPTHPVDEEIKTWNKIALFTYHVKFLIILLYAMDESELETNKNSIKIKHMVPEIKPFQWCSKQ